MEATRAFPATAEAVVDARGFVCEAVIDLRLASHDVDNLILLTNELVANAVFHAGTDVEVRVRKVDAGLRVEVSDGSRDLPVREEVDTDRPRGRGLLMVDELATSWGIDLREDGKAVWFELGGGGPDRQPIDRLAVGIAVDARSRLTGKWASGFKVVAVGSVGYWLSRDSDGTVLSRQVPFEAVRTHASTAPRMR